MTRPIRYQPQEIYAEQEDVTTHLGIDPLTGLPVLICSFPAKPSVDVGVLESENIPSILASSHDGNVGLVVTAYSRDYELVAPGETTLTADFVVEAAKGLRDAARAGVVHGDLRPARFLHAEGHVLIEGFGVPWRPSEATFAAPEKQVDGSYAGDVYSFSRSLLHLGQRQLPTGVVVALERGASASPETRPDAQELYESLKAALGVTRTPPPVDPESTFDDLMLPTDEDELELLDAEALGDDVEAPADTSDGGQEFEFGEMADDQAPAYTPPFRPDPEPLTVNTDPGVGARAGAATPTQSGTDARAPWKTPVRSETSTRDSGAGFVKDLPPGATYHSGELTSDAPPGAFVLESEVNRRRPSIDWRRVVPLAALVVIVGLVAALLLLRPRTNFGSPGGAQVVRYVVTATVEPANLPPVTLIVVDSPSSSSWRPGTIFGNAPGQVVLDQEGRWSFVGQLQDRRSDVVTIDVPSQRSFTLVIPIPPEASEEP